VLIRSLIFTTLFFLLTLLLSVAVLLLAPFGFGARFQVGVVWARVNLWLLERICGLGYAVEGRENIPAESGIAMIKHSSTFETIVVFLLFPPQCIVLKRELMWIPFLGWALALIKPIAIDRNAHRSAVRQVVHTGTARLEENLWVVIFPEGTRMPPGQTRRYGISGALLASETGRPVVPVAHNAGDFWPRRGLRKRPGTIRVVIGPPIDPQGREATGINDAAKAWIDRTMAHISPAHGASIPTDEKS
jgi:1-acyl-sn-glycerol-3-phosphate acyltransferase